MNKRLFLLPVITALLPCYWACENKKSDIAKVASQELTPYEIVENTEILYSEDGEIKVKVITPLIEKYAGEKPYNEMKSGVDITFYDSAMVQTSKLTAEYAIDKIDEYLMEARNDVVVVNEKKEQLNTEHLIWDRKKAIIYSNVFVKITTEDEIIMGEGFESNQDFTKYKIKKPKGTLSREE